MLAAARRRGQRFLPYHIYIPTLYTTTVAVAKKLHASGDRA
jgi:hypothetical protein